MGHQVINSLQKRELETNYIQQDSKKPTGTVKVTLDKNGKPQFQCTTDVAFDYLQIDNKLSDLTHHADAILFGTLAQRNDTSRETIQQFLKQSVHAFKIYDINLRGWDEKIKELVNQSLILADMIKLNDEELDILRNGWKPNVDDISFLQYIIEVYDLKLAALTLGENGCILVQPDEVVEQKGVKINPADTTGCGDAFAAGMIHYFLHEKPLKEIAGFSNLLGAFVARFPGATPEYSTSDLLRFENNLKSRT